jgi:hypothetical protein
MGLVRRHPLWTLVAVGVAVRLVVGFAFVGNSDLVNFAYVDSALDRDPLSVYHAVNPEIGSSMFFRWAYPSLYFAGLEAASGLSDLTGVPFHDTAKLLPILADAGIGGAIYAYLGLRGASQRLRLAGAALVMLGPCFIAISAYHGQFDQVAILPAVLALIAWERRPQIGRAVTSGLLIGVGATLKTVPLLLVLPFLASSRSRGEGVRLVALAVAVPLLLLVPFVIADPTGVLDLRHYRGLPGLGGLSLVTDPANGSAWITDSALSHHRAGIGLFVSENAGPITLASLFALAVFLFRYRPAPIDGAVLLWLTLYSFSPNFFMQYLVWGLPFFIMAGYLLEVAILQLLLIPDLLITYLIPFSDSFPAAAIYVPTMICLWAFWVAALITLGRRVVRRHHAHPSGIQPPLVEFAVPPAAAPTLLTGTARAG